MSRPGRLRIKNTFLEYSAHESINASTFNIVAPNFGFAHASCLPHLLGVAASWKCPVELGYFPNWHTISPVACEQTINTNRQPQPSKVITSRV